MEPDTRGPSTGVLSRPKSTNPLTRALLASLAFGALAVGCPGEDAPFDESSAMEESEDTGDTGETESGSTGETEGESTGETEGESTGETESESTTSTEGEGEGTEETQSESTDTTEGETGDPLPRVDVFLLGGQSNMQGRGRADVIDPENYEQPNVWLWDTVAEEPQWLLHDGPTDLGSGVDSQFGPEVGFGRYYGDARPETTIALVKHARGGKSLAVDWYPGTFGDPQTQGPQYVALMEATEAALAELEQTYPEADVRVRGVLWLQGERDSHEEGMSLAYEANLVLLIERLREDLDEPELGFFYAAILDTELDEVSGYVFNDLVLESQFAVDEDSGAPSATTGAHIVDSREYPSHADIVDGHKDGDYVHFSEAALLMVGEELGELADTLVP
ncbi:hypothetical protein G6O69_23430 [Pseudenhygromyxa sp. WMMC2535]|uniref:sialate O-acetylesterase n=1 Tax=Pseudenhygromyxa sp. WMMC2535 TaxID=2712867 RepID=UPI001554EE94|nr:sialate O-acetylesterase [Pseudenhygromyxa sp. WMMC2535]NVB40811.1 hypothetical protein [Pseudenhygromyxa sp. WMMC2535]